MGHLLHYLFVVRLFPTFLIIAAGIGLESAYVAIAGSGIAQPSLTNRLRNFAYTAIYEFFNVFVSSLGTVYVLTGTVARLSTHNPSFFRTTPSLSSSVAAFTAWSIIADLGYYLVHRALHSSPVLWRIHRLHHDDECMNVTTASRTHCLESFFQNAAFALPAVFMPQPDIAIPVLVVLARVNGFFVHLNIPVPLWHFGKVIVGPQAHRIHHSVDPRHFNSNFAATWQFWDVIFGTYTAPTPGEHPRTGIR